MRCVEKVKGRKIRSYGTITTGHYGSSLQNLCLSDSIESIMALLVQRRDPVREALGLLVQLTLSCLFFNLCCIHRLPVFTHKHKLCIIDCLKTGLVFV